MLFASETISLGRWAMDNTPHDNGKPRNTDERKNYVEGNFVLDGSSLKKIWAWGKRNAKTVERLATWGLVVVSVFGGVSVRNLKNLTLVNRDEMATLTTNVNALTTKTNNLQSDVTTLKEIGNEDKKVITTVKDRERNAKRKKELDDYLKAREEKLKKVGMNNEVLADPSYPPASTAPVKEPAND